jgi:hypothetical protein
MKINIFKDTIDIKEVNHPNLFLFILEQNPGIELSTAYVLAASKLKEIQFYQINSLPIRTTYG